MSWVESSPQHVYYGKPSLGFLVRLLASLIRSMTGPKLTSVGGKIFLEKVSTLNYRDFAHYAFLYLCGSQYCIALEACDDGLDKMIDYPELGWFMKASES